MNNEQLCILIRAWANRLEREIALLKKLLPQDLLKINDEPYAGESLSPLLNKDNWKEVQDTFEILDGLQDFLEELWDAITELSGDTLREAIKTF